MKTMVIAWYHFSLFAVMVLLSSFLTKVVAADQPLFELLPETVTDIDGNIYHTVKIGNQVWMLENLKVTHYRDGTPISRIQDDNDWSNAVAGACCADLTEPDYRDKYGLLYNFAAVMATRGLCPKGWHVPTKEECLELIHCLGGAKAAGAWIKDCTKGFRGLPGGGRGRHGEIGEVGTYGTWWSSSIHDADYAWHWGIFPNKPDIRSNPGHKGSGFSVRCIKNRE
jgi:uncharacterized protein (TIGR02145 family)